MKKLLPFMMIAAGASLWGLIAFFVKGLTSLGFSAMEIVTLRVVFASIILVIIGIAASRPQMKISLRDIHLFAGTGILSIVFFNWCYFTAINQLTISIAVILLYTSPAFVALLSFFFLKEKIDSRKKTAIIGTIVGSVLIAGMSGQDTGSLSPIGTIIGLGAGLGYALYSIFGKFALQKYSAYTVTLYTFVVAALFLLPVTRIWERGEALFDVEVVLLAAGLGLLPTVLAYYLYTWGLERTESSTAAVIATIEPVVAVLLGLFLYGESLGIFQILGSALIILSVCAVNLRADGSKNVFTKKSLH
ncbi:EamA family transporter [Bacillus canaveralius]|uniref:EamA family transporter n=1 Tax=Bacillus canaveralius TaxID=1403243 RepID=A0A2N5GFY4_9BACI|nr:EamA family transporter [Bacillus canaveralius]PLR79620.1 EamA family transporter [Bacillus canaveralius]PLR96482.1 EamA family transporter [Bacillus canaveralius]